MAGIARQSIGFEQSSAILESYIKDGSVWAMPFWNGRAQLLVDSGAPVDYIRPREGTIPLIATLSVPVGAENKEAAYRFIDFFLRKSSQEAWVEGYRVGSARTDIVVTLKLPSPVVLSPSRPASSTRETFSGRYQPGVLRSTSMA